MPFSGEWKYLKGNLVAVINMFMSTHHRRRSLQQEVVTF